MSECFSCINEREFNVFVLSFKVDESYKCFILESWSNMKTGEEKAIWKIWQCGIILFCKLSFFMFFIFSLSFLHFIERVSIISHFGNQYHHINWTIYFPAAIIKSIFRKYVQESVKVNNNKSGCWAYYWSQEGVFFVDLNGYKCHNRGK